MSVNCCWLIVVHQTTASIEKDHLNVYLAALTDSIDLPTHCSV